MSSISQPGRNFVFLIFSGCLLGVTMPGHAQGVTVTPAAPEAFQPFTLEWFACMPSESVYDETAVIVSAEEHTIFLLYSPPTESCSFESYVLKKKVANVRGLPGGTYRILISGGDTFLIPNPPVEVGSVDISSPPQPIDGVAEFRNRTTLHYFLTADYDESMLLRGVGGVRDWYESGRVFYAWPGYGPAPAAAKPVCRFYSSLVNSHFYTAGVGECEALKQPGSGWTYEGIAFRALVPTKGVCYPGTTPVWRLYNGRAAQNDTNHRFVTSADVYWHMMANGWIGEGVVFCAIS